MAATSAIEVPASPRRLAAALFGPPGRRPRGRRYAGGSRNRRAAGLARAIPGRRCGR